MITKKELAEILWGLATGNEHYINIRSESSFIKNSVADYEWIFCKDIELSLKKIYQAMQRGEFDYSGNIVEEILREEIDPQFESDEYILEKIKDCKENMSKLSNPEQSMATSPSMHQEYEAFLDQDFNDDYWSDIALGKAAEILVQFTQQDWHSLKCSVSYKRTTWQRRCAETLSEVESPIAISILKQLMENSDNEVIIAASESLNALGK